MDKIARLPGEPARDYAVRFLKHNILNLHLAPGTMVSSADISALTGVSRTPVREAMQELEKLGVLEIFPQAGSRISYINYDTIHESSCIRQTLETSVVSLACDMITPEQESVFRQILHAQQQHVEQFGNQGFLDIDHAFHQHLYQMTNRMLTYQTMRNCMWHFDRLRRLSFSAVSVKTFLKDHTNIFDAIARRDKRRAKQLTIRHLTRYLKDEKIIRAKYPQYFAD